MNGALSDNNWAWYDTGPADGAWNMAADQYFAEHMAAGELPVMRIYTWRPWCISLGYHQSTACIDLDKCKAKRIDVVRRRTGGRAVFHAQELTYSVILPKDHRFAVSVTDTYRRISTGLARGLQLSGIPASFEKRMIDLKAHYEKKISASCFSAAALHEIVIDGRKLVGSAQRRLPGAVLQHGSILIGTAHLELFDYLAGLRNDEKEAMAAVTTEKTTTIESFLNRSVSPAALGNALKKGVEESLNITFQNRELTEKEAGMIESEKYRFSILSV